MHQLFRSVISVVAIMGCSSITSTAKGISVLLEANPKTVQVGDTVTFVVSVVGNNVSRISIDFGDATGDESTAGGLPTAQLTFRHAYLATGTFMSRASITDAAVGVRNVSQEIVVIPRSDPPQARR